MQILGDNHLEKLAIFYLYAKVLLNLQLFVISVEKMLILLLEQLKVKKLK